MLYCGSLRSERRYGARRKPTITKVTTLTTVTAVTTITTITKADRLAESVQSESEARADQKRCGSSGTYAWNIIGNSCERIEP